MRVKNLLKCKVTIFILLAWLAFSVIGFWGKDTIYQNYNADLKTTPYFVLVLQGIHDGVYPWSRLPESIAKQPYMTSGGEMQDPENGMQNISPDYGTDAAETGGKDAGQWDELSKGEADRWDRIRVFTQVDESYFDDAVFIGDSRTVGLHDYSGLDKATFYATVGMNVYDLWTDEFCDVDGEKTTLEEALTRKQFKKVYFQIGINEMGRGTVDGFMEAYEQSIEKFKELQPDAVIFVQGIMRVTKNKTDTDPIFNNEGINERNERIAKLADNRRVFYIDVNEVVCDDSGNLSEDLTFDELHLYGSKYGIWVDFLKTKGIRI